MSFDFPSSPTEGQVFSPPTGPTYIYNAPVWKAAGQGQIVAIADAPPANPAIGTLYWDSDLGVLFLWYHDGTSAQWVQVGGVAQAKAGIEEKTLLEDQTITAQPNFAFNYYTGWPTIYDRFEIEIPYFNGITSNCYFGMRLKQGNPGVIQTGGNYAWTQVLHQFDAQGGYDGSTTAASVSGGFNALIPLSRTLAAAYIAPGPTGRNSFHIDFPNPTKQVTLGYTDMPAEWRATLWSATGQFNRLAGAGYLLWTAGNPITGLHFFAGPGTINMNCRAKLWGVRTT